DLVRPEPRPDRLHVADAEAAAEDAGLAEDAERGRRQARGTARDQRADRARDEARRVASEPPLPVDLLERARLAVRARQLLDDERHALRLGLHRRDRLPLDRPAEDLPQEQPGL